MLFVDGPLWASQSNFSDFRESVTYREMAREISKLIHSRANPSGCGVVQRVLRSCLQLPMLFARSTNIVASAGMRTFMPNIQGAILEAFPIHPPFASRLADVGSKFHGYCVHGPPRGNDTTIVPTASQGASTLAMRGSRFRMIFYSSARALQTKITWLATMGPREGG